MGARAPLPHENGCSLHRPGSRRRGGESASPTFKQRCRDGECAARAPRAERAQAVAIMTCPRPKCMPPDRHRERRAWWDGPPRFFRQHSSRRHYRNLTRADVPPHPLTPSTREPPLRTDARLARPSLPSGTGRNGIAITINSLHPAHCCPPATWPLAQMALTHGVRLNCAGQFPHGCSSPAPRCPFFVLHDDATDLFPGALTGLHSPGICLPAPLLLLSLVGIVQSHLSARPPLELPNRLESRRG
jgi:hypothetical protein